MSKTELKYVNEHIYEIEECPVLSDMLKVTIKLSPFANDRITPEDIEDLPLFEIFQEGTTYEVTSAYLPNEISEKDCLYECICLCRRVDSTEVDRAIRDIEGDLRKLKQYIKEKNA